MNIDHKRDGIIVLNEAVLNEYGDKIAGGTWTAAEAIELTGALVALVGTGYGVFLAARAALSGNAAVARIAADCFGRHTKSCALALAAHMRGMYAAASARYNYYNHVYFRIRDHDDNIIEACTDANNRGFGLV